MKLKALKPTESMTANQIRPFIKKKAKPPIAKYLPYLFFLKIFFNFDNENINQTAACLIESLTLPLSKPMTFTFTSSPSFTTSVTFATLLSASSDI